MEWQAGDVSGLLPYSRLTKAPGTALVVSMSGAIGVGFAPRIGFLGVTFKPATSPEDAAAFLRDADIA